MKKFNCGDVVWCWERTADDFLINGFKAQCKVDVNKFDDCLQVVTESGDVKSVYIRDTEPYNEFIKYREHESIMNAFKKFKTLSHNKKKEMLQKIGLLKQEDCEQKNKDPMPDPYSMPEDDAGDWDAKKCLNFEECWCGGCADACS